MSDFSDVFKTEYNYKEDAENLITLLESLKGLDYNENNLSVLSINQTTPNAYDSIMLNFPASSYISGTHTESKTHDGEPALTFDDNSFSINHYYNDCIFMINPHLYVNIQLEWTAENKGYKINLIPFYSFNSEEGLRLDCVSYGYNTTTYRIVLYEQTHIVSISPYKMLTDVDYANVRFQPVSKIIKPVSIDQIINIIKKEYKKGISRTRKVEI